MTTHAVPASMLPSRFQSFPQSHADAPYSAEMPLEDRRYSLDIVQQPTRARMCGFGDKDRRPITPPPCVRVVVTSLKTGEEIDVNNIDHSLFVLNVTLWSADGSESMDTVAHSAQNYQSSEENTAIPSPMGSSSHSAIYQRDSHRQGNYPYTESSSNGSWSDASYNPYPAYTTQSYPNYSQPNDMGRVGPDYVPDLKPSMAPRQGGSRVRNLIGSLAASAFRLTDPEDRVGIWFILQDMSVRTEGTFRLKFSFVDLSEPAVNGVRSGEVTTGRAPLLASCFSEPFTVYSAKKFPGVVESTPLSKCFATQGIKIPIRKEGVAGGKGRDADVDDED